MNDRYAPLRFPDFCVCLTRPIRRRGYSSFGSSQEADTHITKSWTASGDGDPDAYGGGYRNDSSADESVAAALKVLENPDEVGVRPSQLRF